MIEISLCAPLQASNVQLPDFYTQLTAWSTLCTGIATLLLVLTGIGAMIFADRQIKAERAYRQVENLEREIAKFKTGECLKARSILAQYRISSRCLDIVDDATVPSSAYELLNFFEHVGLLARSGHLERRAVWHSLGWWILLLNYDLAPLLHQQRARNKSVLQDFEWLAMQIQEIEAREEGRALEINAELLCEFYKDELADKTVPTR